MLACCAVAAAVVAVDAYFSAQEGYLSRAPDYDGVKDEYRSETCIQVINEARHAVLTGIT